MENVESDDIMRIDFIVCLVCVVIVRQSVFQQLMEQPESFIFPLRIRSRSLLWSPRIEPRKARNHFLIVMLLALQSLTKCFPSIDINEFCLEALCRSQDHSQLSNMLNVRLRAMDDCDMSKQLRVNIWAVSPHLVIERLHLSYYALLFAQQHTKIGVNHVWKKVRPPMWDPIFVCLKWREREREKKTFNYLFKVIFAMETLSNHSRLAGRHAAFE